MASGKDTTAVNNALWIEVLDELLIAHHPCVAPEHTSLAGAREWFQTWTQFLRTSFSRLLISPSPTSIGLHLELGLNIPDVSVSSLIARVRQYLSEQSALEWTIIHTEMPWRLESTVPPDDSHEETRRQLSKALQTITTLGDFIQQFEQRANIHQFMEALGGEAMSGSIATSEEAKPTGAVAFESIGQTALPEADVVQDVSTSHVHAANATLAGTQLRIVDEAIIVSLGIAQILTGEQIETLFRGFDRHLRIKFDVQVRQLTDDAQTSMNSSQDIENSETQLHMQIMPAPHATDTTLAELKGVIEDDLHKLSEFNQFGVDLFETLGVHGPSAASSPVDSSPAVKPSPLRALRDRDKISASEKPSGVILDLPLSGVDATTTVFGATQRSYERPDYTDPRLHRPDATTALVDVVLRHPGYSDERIGQVLSILLSIEYPAALRLVESAPCAIAWAVSNARARTFKEVIEATGAKVVLVEPGSFATI